VQRVEIIGGVDQRKMRQRLREIAEKSVRIDIKLFRKETHVVTDIEKALEYTAGFVMLTLQNEVVDEPK
jgi:hypothetical protein